MYEWPIWSNFLLVHYFKDQTPSTISDPQIHPFMDPDTQHRSQII